MQFLVLFLLVVEQFFCDLYFNSTNNNPIYISETKYMIISHNNIPVDINLEIRDNIQECVSTTKFLGPNINKK